MIILHDNDSKKLKIIKEKNIFNIIEDIYYLKYKLPNEKELLSSDDPKIKEIVKEYDSVTDFITHIKKMISTHSDKVILFDIFSQNFYIVDKNNFYIKVILQHYRYPDKQIIDALKDKYEYYEKNKHTISKNELEHRKHKKIILMLDFLECFDHDILLDRYYKYFFQTTNQITTCLRSSFINNYFHNTPYYNKYEMFDYANILGYDIDNKSDEQICKFVQQNDISANIILKHQSHIITNNKVNLIQQYTLFQSYFMNNYLRNINNTNNKNTFLESMILNMNSLISTAPAFDKEYVLFRHIRDDKYLTNLKIGDIYFDNSFLSTTRDYSYRNDLYDFGHILIKVKIQANTVGAGLLIETLSYFHDEKEVLLPSGGLYRLEKKNDDCKYTSKKHIEVKDTLVSMKDLNVNEETQEYNKTRYEFTYIGRKDTILSYGIEPHIMEIDFIRISYDDNKHVYVTLEEKISLFTNKYLNDNYQFYSKIGDKQFLIISDRYNSTTSYRPFFAVVNQNGFMFYTIVNNNILFMIEIGEVNSYKYMHVNYYVKYCTIEKTKLYTEENFIQFISSIAMYFGIDKVHLWCDYKSCDTLMNTFDDTKDKEVNLNIPIMRYNRKNQRGYDTDIKTTSSSKSVRYIRNAENDDDNINYDLGGVYCVDFYAYYTKNIKKYEMFNPNEITEGFYYSDLDKLKKISPKTILDSEDLDDLYQIYNKIYLKIINDKTNDNNDKHNNDMVYEDSISSFYIWLIKNKCYIVDIYVKKIKYIFSSNNPFDNSYYIIDPVTFLYNRKMIKSYPNSLFNNNIKKDRRIMPVNTYRT